MNAESKFVFRILVLLRNVSTIRARRITNVLLISVSIELEMFHFIFYFV